MKRTVLSIFLGCFCLVGVIWNAFADTAREYNPATDASTHKKIGRDSLVISFPGNRDDAVRVCVMGLDSLIRYGVELTFRVTDKLTAMRIPSVQADPIVYDLIAVNKPKWELVVLEEPSATSPQIKFQCNYYLSTQPR